MGERRKTKTKNEKKKRRGEVQKSRLVRGNNFCCLSSSIHFEYKHQKESSLVILHIIQKLIIHQNDLAKNFHNGNYTYMLCLQETIFAFFSKLTFSYFCASVHTIFPCERLCSWMCHPTSMGQYSLNIYCLSTIYRTLL